MTFQADDVAKIAALAKLEFDTEQLDELSNELNHIFAIVDQLKAVNTEKTPPLAHPLDQTQPLRADVVTEPSHREVCLALAPETGEHLFLVPPAIEGE
jgi:aspartyl-tRNA(Asn)/glutamyl-tRNA(Gln) amidotransferase subunit C